MAEDIRPYEVQRHNPGIHEITGDQARPSGFRRLLAIGAVTLLGVGTYNHVTEADLSDYFSGDVPEYVSPEMATPEVAQVNAALAEVRLGQQNNLDTLVEAIKVADAIYAPNDKDRLPEMPAGYVKFMLPHEAKGIAVPYTVAERTTDNERYTSPEMAAQLLATAKLYQDLIAAKYPELAGEMLRVRDLQSQFHGGHKTGEADISGAFGFDVTQYSSGALADQQFSKRFRSDFTIDMAVAMGGLKVGDKPVIRKIIYSDRNINSVVNDQLGRYFMEYAQWHDDHLHQYSYSYLPAWSPVAEQYPWGKSQDLHVGGMAQPITPEQYASQHQDFVTWINERAKYLGQMNAQENQTAPEGFTAEPLAESAEQHISKLDISDGRKDFLRTMVPSIATVYRAGAKINPTAALAQTSIETGFAADELSRDYHNYFGIKAGKNWQGDSVNLDTLEEYTAGDVEQIKDNFRVYPDATSSVADYARFVQTRPWYADAVANYQSVEGYVNGLFSEVDAQGNIVREQGTEGVLSYGTDSGYEQKVFDMIDQLSYEELMKAQLEGKA